jgi:heptosyltransferase-2
MMMAQTLFKYLKQRNPHVAIDVLAPAWSRALLERMPEVSQTHVFPFGHGELALWKRYQFGKSLRVHRYDQAIVLPNTLKSALVMYAAGIPQRTGWQGEWPRGWLFLNDARGLDKEKLPQMIQRFAALAQPADMPLPAVLPKPQLTVTPAAVEAALQKYQLGGRSARAPGVSVNREQTVDTSGAPILMLAPGAEFGPSKRWPAKYFADVAQAKLAQGWQVWMFGSPNDMAIADEIQQQLQGRAVNLIGKTNLAEAVDLLSLATAVVSNDSGLMHIAAALGRPLVAIYGSTSPRFTPPLSDKVTILSLQLECSPCFQRECPLGHWKCMLELKPERVLQALDGLLA